jgi:hypothetical protein
MCPQSTDSGFPPRLRRLRRVLVLGVLISAPFRADVLGLDVREQLAVRRSQCLIVVQQMRKGLTQQKRSTPERYIYTLLPPTFQVS